MKILFLLLTLIFVSSAIAQPTVEWRRSNGGSQTDIAQRVIPTTDGGVIVVGSTSSSDVDIGSAIGLSDGWLVKYSSTGAIEWDKTYGGNLNDSLFSIVETYDGSYVMVGCTESQTLVGTSPKGTMDVWVVKISNDGILQWQRTLGGSNNDIGKSIQITPDSGFVIGATSFSTNGDVNSNNGGADVWVVKLTTDGTMQWSRNYGGSNNDMIGEIAIRANGDFIFVATTESNNGDVTGYRGGKDYWVVTLFSTGQIQWQKAIGGTGNDIANAVIQNSNGDYLITGTSNSNNSDINGNIGGYDIWSVMLNTGGDIVWTRNYGGSGDETGVAIRSTVTSEYVIVGNSTSTNGDLTNNNGNTDAWIFQITSTSELQWQKSLGGSGADGFLGVCYTKDKGLCAVGYSSNATDDVTTNKGATDSWIVKFAGVPKAGFTTSTDTICNDGFIELQVQSNTPSEETIWVLKGAKDTIMIGNTVVAEYPDSGIFPITVITKNSMGNDTLTELNRIVVFAKPKPGIEGKTNICESDADIPLVYRPKRSYSTNESTLEWRLEDNDNEPIYTLPDQTSFVVWKKKGAKLTLIETVNSTGCKDSSTITAEFIPSPESEFTGHIDSICPNTTLNFTKVSDAENIVYSWDVSRLSPLVIGREILQSTSDSITVKWISSGLFTISLLATDTLTSCVTTNKKNVYVHYEPIPLISPIIDTICGSNRKTYRIANYNETDQFDWSATNGRIVYKMADTAIIQWDGTTDGIVTVIQKTPEIPCPGSKSWTQHIKVNPMKPTVTRIGNLLTASSASSYQWYFNQNAVPGATNQTFNITDEGFYSVYATFDNGECGAFSDIISTITSIAEIVEPTYNIQPNPTNGIIRFTCNFEHISIINVDVITSLGLPIMTFGKLETKGQYQKELNCSSLPTGIYFLRIQSQQQTNIIPFIKQ